MSTLAADMYIQWVVQRAYATYRLPSVELHRCVSNTAYCFLSAANRAHKSSVLGSPDAVLVLVTGAALGVLGRAGAAAGALADSAVVLAGSVPAFASAGAGSGTLAGCGSGAS